MEKEQEIRMPNKNCFFLLFWYRYISLIFLSLRTSTDRYANVDVGVLLYHIERFPGIIILTTNLIDNIDKAFFRRLRYVLQLNVPGEKLRVKLWKVSRVLPRIFSGIGEVLPYSSKKGP